MTGEISLKGRVLGVGGIKEKCIAAYSNGIKMLSFINLILLSIFFFFKLELYYLIVILKILRRFQ